MTVFATAYVSEPDIRAQDGGVSSQTPQREAATVPPSDPLALDPCSPALPARALERESDPLALDPYSPILLARTPIG